MSNEGFGSFEAKKVEGATTFAGSVGVTREKALENLNTEFAENLNQELTKNDVEFIEVSGGFQAKISLNSLQKGPTEGGSYENKEV